MNMIKEKTKKWMKPGQYQIKNSLTNETILFDIGVHTAERMDSLLPKENGGSHKKGDINEK